VVHDEKGDISKKIEQISNYGYKLLGHFILSRDIWWSEYYVYLQRLIDDIRKNSSDNPEIHSMIDSEQREIDMFKSNPNRFSSIFFIMQKR